MKPSHLKANLNEYARVRRELYNLCESGIKANTKDLKLFIKWLEETKCEKVNGHVLMDFMSYLKNERKNQHCSINRKISSIKQYLNWLNFIDVEDADKVKVGLWRRACAPYDGPISVLEPEEIQRLLDLNDRESVLGFRDFTLFTLMYRLGLRIGEARRIKFQDINLKKETLVVLGKGRKTRTLPLTKDLIGLIQSWIEVRKNLKNYSSLDELFISQKGAAIAERTIQENFKKLVAKAGTLTLEKVTPHSLRHAFASHALDDDSELITIKYFLGHAHLSTTELYLHPSMKKMRKCVNDHVAHDIINELIDQEILILRIHQQTG